MPGWDGWASLLSLARAFSQCGDLEVVRLFTWWLEPSKGQGLEAASLLKSRPENGHSIIFAVFYWTKQSPNPPRPKGRGHRTPLLDGVLWVPNNWPSLICLILSLAFPTVFHKWYDITFPDFSFITDSSSLVSLSAILPPLFERPLPFSLSLLIYLGISYLLLWLQSPPLGWWCLRSLWTSTLTLWLTQPRSLYDSWERYLDEARAHPPMGRATSFVQKAARSSLYSFPESLLLVQLHHICGNLHEWPPQMTA